MTPGRFGVQTVTNACRFALPGSEPQSLAQVCHEMHALERFDRANGDRFVPSVLPVRSPHPPWTEVIIASKEGAGSSAEKKGQPVGVHARHT